MPSTTQHAYTVQAHRVKARVYRLCVMAMPTAIQPARCAECAWRAICSMKNQRRLKARCEVAPGAVLWRSACSTTPRPRRSAVVSRPVPESQ